MQCATYDEAALYGSDPKRGPLLSKYYPHAPTHPQALQKSQPSFLITA